jgi:hypothetical protein
MQPVLATNCEMEELKKKTLIISTVFMKRLRNAPLNFTAFSLQAVS